MANGLKNRASKRKAKAKLKSITQDEADAVVRNFMKAVYGLGFFSRVGIAFSIIFKKKGKGKV